MGLKGVIISFVLAAMVSSCVKHDDFGPQGEPVVGEVNPLFSGALLINEGNFGYNNASISLLDLDSIQIQNNVFEKANGLKLGDVGQSAVIVDSLAIILVNNSNRIRVLNLRTMELIKDLVTTGSPRYGLEHKGKVLITTMSSGLLELDLSDFSLKVKLTISGWCEELMVNDNLLYIVNRENDELVEIDLSDFKILNRYPTGIDPESVVKDNNGEVYVLTTGGFAKNDQELARIQRLDRSNGVLKDEFEFADIEASPTRLRYNKSENKLYFLERGVYQYDLNSRQGSLLYEQPLGSIYYGLAINEQSQEIWLTDVKDYVQNGQLMRLDLSGNILSSSTAGIIPQYVTFY